MPYILGGIRGQFAELGEEMSRWLEALYPSEGRNIWIGANALPWPPIGNGYPEPSGTDIIFQHEPMHCVPRQSWYFERLATVAEVWDYSRTNQGQYDAKVKRHCPIRFTPALQTIHPSQFSRTLPEYPWPTIELGFFGSLNERRKKILGPDVECLPYCTWGAERDRWLARCKVVVVPHQDEGSPVEQFRIALLLANGIAVVAEEAPDQDDYPGPIYVPASKIIDTALEIIEEDEFLSVGQDQYETFRDEWLRGDLGVIR